MFWIVTETKRSARTAYLIDGVDEAMAELIAGLKVISLPCFVTIPVIIESTV